MGQVLEVDNLNSRLRADRSDKKVVFTNGCFDLLHLGHVTYLKEAKALGDILVVGVNDDNSVTRLKGLLRPIYPLAQRAQILAALASVDYVVGFSESTPVELIRQIQPDIHVKGGDYREEDLPEAEIVKGYGGQVVIMPYQEDYSTTRIIQEILKKSSGSSNI